MNKNVNNIRLMILCAIFAALTVVSTYIRIDTGVVSFTMQTLIVTLAGLLLGPTGGAVSMSVYVALGLIGLPVFTNGGGIGAFLSPSFGFVIGFILSAYVTGLVAEKLGNKYYALMFAALCGLFVLYIFGLIYGYFILNIYLGKGMGIGKLIWTFVGMFVPFDVIKCLLASLLAIKLIPLIKK